MTTEPTPHTPFRPQPVGTPGPAMPPTVPTGLRLDLRRARVAPGQEAELDAWMAMLTERYDECLQTLPAEHGVFESIFRHREADGSLWIYHLSLMGEGGSGLGETHPVDVAHADFSRRVKEYGWEVLDPLFMLTPAHLGTAMQRWGATGVAD